MLCATAAAAAGVSSTPYFCINRSLKSQIKTYTLCVHLLYIKKQVNRKANAQQITSQQLGDSKNMYIMLTALECWKFIKPFYFYDGSSM